MPKTLTIGPFRISQTEYEAIKTATEAHEEKTAEFIRAAAAFQTDLSTETRQRLQTFADHLHLRPGMIAEALLMRYFAEREARRQIWGDTTLTPDIEFTVVNGELLTGDALYSMLLKHFSQRYAQQREEQIFVGAFRGRTPTEDDEQFLQDHGPETRRQRLAHEDLARRQATEALLQEAIAAGFPDVAYIPPGYHGAIAALYEEVKNGQCEAEVFREQVAQLITRTRGITAQPGLPSPYPGV